jgi:hypothetical protein
VCLSQVGGWALSVWTVRAPQRAWIQALVKKRWRAAACPELNGTSVAIGASGAPDRRCASVPATGELIPLRLGELTRDKPRYLPSSAPLMSRLSAGRQQPKEAIEGFVGVIEGHGELPCFLDADNAPLGLAVRPAAYDESKSYVLVDVHADYVALNLETRAGRRGIHQFYEKRLRAFRDAGSDG